MRWTFANFLYNQFGVQTLSYGGWYRRPDDKDTQAGIFTLETLQENETIARLATGVKRFALPDEYNSIKLFQQIAAEKGRLAVNANNMLGAIFQDRRQYDRAAEYFKLAGSADQVRQILGNWGQFGPVMTQPAGKGATVEYLFRNGTKAAPDRPRHRHGQAARGYQVPPESGTQAGGIPGVEHQRPGVSSAGEGPGQVPGQAGRRLGREAGAAAQALRPPGDPSPRR